MSLFARFRAVTTALDKQGYSYTPAQDPQKNGKLNIVEFGRCPACNGAAGSKLGLYADGTCNFSCQDCDCCSAADVLGIFGLDFDRPARKSITPVDYDDFCQLHSEERPVYIENLLRRAEIVNVVGGSKGKKTRFVAQLILSLVTSGMFLGLFKCVRPKGKALVCDYELHPDSIVKRLNGMIKAMPGMPKDIGRRFQYHSMRGTNYMDLFQLCDWIESLPPETYSIVVIDALYRATPEGHDENSNAGVTKLYNRMDQAAIKHKCSFVVVHHFSKGNQSDKAVADLGSGAGAQSRAADCHLALREHAAPGHVVLSGIVRDFAPLDDVVLRYAHPLWVHAPGVNPADTSKQEKRNSVEMAALLDSSPTAKTQFEATAASRLGISQSSAKRLLESAIGEGIVTHRKGKGGNPSLVHITKEQSRVIEDKLLELNKRQVA